MVEKTLNKARPWQQSAFLITAVSALLVSAPIYGQDPALTDTMAVDHPPTAEGPAEGVRVYLDCQGCDFTYIRRNVPFVNYVRDPQSAQVHVLVTNQGTGSGGRAFRLSFLGREQFRGQDHQLPFVSQASDTEDARRKGFTQSLKLGLLPYVAQTPLASQIEVGFDAAGSQAGRAQPGRDAWNNWVFRVGAGGSLDLEESRGEYEFRGFFSADRVTEEWKLRSRIQVEYDRREFKDDGESITSTIRDFFASTSAVKSLNSRWSLAVFGDAYTNTPSNIEGALRLTPGIQYNIFPWDVSDRKVFTIAYTAGLRSFQYMEETIYGQLGETLPFESLRSELRLTQPWGSFRANLEGSHYFHDLEKYRVQLGSNLAFRLTRGLSLELGASAESIHDQLYLRKGNASLEEILLQRRRLATTYEFESSIGLRYTFGSIYNNVVNPRF